MTDDVDPRDEAQDVAFEVAQITGTSGDPMLKRLVDLAHLGWSAELTLFSNGAILVGRLISPAQFRAALGESIRGRSTDERASLLGLDAVVVGIIEAEEPPMSDVSTVAEPRYLHLANVTLRGQGRQEMVPFMRLRLPAVSGWWVSTESPADEAR